jgi:hypothetical protein
VFSHRPFAQDRRQDGPLASLERASQASKGFGAHFDPILQ